jgi:UDP-2-acetamido-2-deoxy-ribo-hexuluronate aminotransferase
MVDLKGQYDKIKSEIDAAISGVLDTTAFIKGPDVSSFEAEMATFLGVKHVIGCANGTDALQIAMMALPLQPGDEVISPDFTFIATNEVVALLGLKPVLVDVDPETFTIDPEKIRQAITPRTKAIVPVHLFGQCADMAAILEIAREHKLFIIEDNAQALGSMYRFPNGEEQMAGTMGTIGCTSFFPSKNLGCFGDGGALFTNDDQLAEKIRIVANHGMKVRYYHDEIGINSRLDTLQAAILRVKLRHLHQYNTARQKAASFYDKAFSAIPSLQIPARNPASTHIFHQYTLRLKNGNREGLIRHLGEKEIPAMIYYPVAMHHQKAYLDPRYREADFSVSNMLCEEVFSLPMHTELEPEQLDFICREVIDFLKK